MAQSTAKPVGPVGNKQAPLLPTRAVFANTIIQRLVGTSTALLTRWGARRALVSLMIAESGTLANSCIPISPGAYTCKVGTAGARNNPLNTTLEYQNVAHDYNSVHVQNYPSYDVGVSQTVLTLNDPRYVDIKAAILKPWGSSESVLLAWAASQWGTPSDLVFAAWQTYSQDPTKYNNLTVGP